MKNKNARAAEELMRTLRLRHDPIAIKMISDESEIPENALYRLLPR